jgi:hypothetical protein
MRELQQQQRHTPAGSRQQSTTSGSESGGRAGEAVGSGSMFVQVFELSKLPSTCHKHDFRHTSPHPQRCCCSCCCQIILKAVRQSMTAALASLGLSMWGHCMLHAAAAAAARYNAMLHGASTLITAHLGLLMFRRFMLLLLLLLPPPVTSPCHITSNNS